MKNILFILIILAGCINAEKKTQVPDILCNRSYDTYRETDHSGNLSIGDEIRHFSGITSLKNEFSTSGWKGEFVIIYFVPQLKGIYTFIDNEYKPIEKMVRSQNGHIIILNDPKIAKLYGLNYKLKEGIILFEKSVAFVTDKNHKVVKIYEEVCEQDLVHIIQKMDSILKDMIINAQE